MKHIITVFFLASLTFSCTDNNQNKALNEELTALKAEMDSIKNLNSAMPIESETEILTFLTFQESNAEEAMNFYVELFDNSKIIDVQRYGKDGPAKEGTIFVAKFELNGRPFACSDSYIKHEWDFTPGVSNFVECQTDEKMEFLFAKLSESGEVLMPPDNYGFSTKFAFVVDRFGISWQLNLQ